MRLTACAIRRMAIRLPVYQLNVGVQQFCFEFQRRRDAKGRAVAHRAGREVAELATAVVHRGDDANDLPLHGVFEYGLQMLDDLRITLPCDELQNGGRILVV